MTLRGLLMTANNPATAKVRRGAPVILCALHKSFEVDAPISSYCGGPGSLLRVSGRLQPSVKSNDCWNRKASAVEPPAGTVPSI